MDTLLTELLTLLRTAGFHCTAAFPHDYLPRLRAPMLAVGFAAASEADTDVAHSARTLRCTARLDVYFPYTLGAQSAPAYLEGLLLTLQNGLEHASIERVDLGKLSFDPDADCFCCAVTAQLRTLRCRSEEK